MFPIDNRYKIDTRLLELHFIITSSVLLFSFVLLFFNQESLTTHYFNPKLLAITHLVVLGCLTVLIFGILSQLLPFFINAKLYSKSLIIFALVFLLSGTFIIAFAFWNFYVGFYLQLGGTLVLTGVSIFAFNIFKTFGLSDNNEIESDFIQTSVFWLIVTVIIGFLMAVNFTVPFISQSHLEMLKIHSHAGLMGWFLQMIIGVSSHLIPMFVVAHNFDKKILKIVYYLLNFSLISAFAAIFWELELLRLSAILGVIVSVILFLIFMFKVFKNRNKNKLDSGMKQSFGAFLFIPFFIIPFFLGMFFMDKSPDSYTTSYVFLLIGGFIISLVMGQTYKILSYVVWIRKYKQNIETETNIFPRDLYSHQIVHLQSLLFFIAVILTASGVAFQHKSVINVGLLLTVIAVALFNYLIFNIIFGKPNIHQHDTRN